MITASNSPAKGSGIPNHYVGDLLRTMRISGRSRVRTELFELTVIPALMPHSVQMYRQFASHCSSRRPLHWWLAMDSNHPRRLYESRVLPTELASLVFPRNWLAGQDSNLRMA